MCEANESRVFSCLSVFLRRYQFASRLRSLFRHSNRASVQLQALSLPMHPIQVQIKKKKKKDVSGALSQWNSNLITMTLTNRTH